MKILDQVKPWPTKVNFVDTNNAVVGYDMQQDCCEHADWCIAGVPELGSGLGNGITEASLGPYVFAPDVATNHDFPRDTPDECSAVSFKLVADGRPDLFLTLHNTHNGYYAHGFEIWADGKLVNEGSL